MRCLIFAILMVILATVLAGPALADEAGLTVTAVGDIMMGTENLLPADGGASLFSDASPYLKKGDIVFGNHEGTLTERGKPTKVSKSGRAYCFRTPPAYTRHLAEAGFNMISIANNHIYDYGQVGKDDTIANLDRHGISWSGPVGSFARLTARGLKVSMVAFHTSAHSHWVLDIPGAKRIVSGLAKSSDIVIASFHGGAEGTKALHVPHGMEQFYSEKRGDLRAFSHAVVDAGADLVVGHGPHVPRAMEVYKDRLIAYSLGNFCTGKGISVKGEAGLAPLLIAELNADGSIKSGRIVSFWQGFGQPPKFDKAGRAAKLMYRLGQTDFPVTNALNPGGNIVAPPR